MTIFSLILFFSSLSIGQTKWAPIVMNDIITFVPYKKSIVPPVDTSIVLSSAQAQTNIADKGTYVHYKIYAHAGDQLKVDLYDMDANGNLYVKMGSSASINSNDCKSENGGQTHSTQSESCTITANSDGYIYMAVHAPSYGCYTNVEHTIKATIGDIVYGEFGDYENSVEDKYPNDNYKSVYYVPGLQNAPVVVFITGYSSALSHYDGLLRFIASHGYYVIAIHEDGANTNPHWTNPVSKHAANIETLLLNNAIDNDGVDASKLAVIGHSLGGGDTFAIMDYFKNHNRNHAGTTYASAANFVISLDGYFAYDMTTAQMSSLNTTTLMMQFGGLNGINPYGNYDYMQDPRINLTIYDRLVGDEKAYSVIAPENHRYLYGNADSVRNKVDLLKPIDALLDYKFGNGGQYAKDISLVNRYHEVINALPPKDANYDYGCSVGDGESQCNDY